MNHSKYNNFVKSADIAQSTVDIILSKGGSILYDRYIQTKIPKNVRASFEKIIENVFQPTINNQIQGERGVKRIHQSFTHKINLLEQKKKNQLKYDSVRKSMLSENAKTIEVDNNIVRKIDIKETFQKKQQQTKLKAKDSCKQISLSTNLEQKRDQFQNKREQRQQRLKNQLLKEKEQRQRRQKSNRLKKQLEQQLRQLQENKKTITFDHHSGRLFHLQEHHIYSQEQNKIKKNIINLRYDFTDQKNLSTDKQFKQSFISNSRKIMGFQRNKRKFNFINQKTDDSNYNNHGKRQTSVASFIQLQEGINVFEGKNTDILNYRYNNRKNRINFASLTQRTFKSYVKQKMETTRFVKSRTTATSASKTRQINRDKVQKKDSSVTKQSVLWNKLGDNKNHKISKNPQLVNNYFDFSQ